MDSDQIRNEPDVLDIARYAVERARMGVFCVRPEGTLAYVNQFASERLGYDLSDLQGMHIAEVNPEFPHSAWGEHWEEIKGRGRLQLSTRHRDSCGRMLPVSVDANHVVIGGNSYKLAFVSYPETQGTEGACSLGPAHQQWLLSPPFGEPFEEHIEGIAHDLNNMLQVISTHMDICLHHPQVSSARHSIEQALQATGHATELTRRLLTQKRRNLTRYETIDVYDLLDDLSSMLEKALGEHIKLTCQVKGDVHSIRGDKELLFQALANLCINARDAMPMGGDLLLEGSNVPRVPESGEGAAAPQVLIQVSDTGSGIAEGTLKRIFEPYFTTKSTGHSLGLGLMGVRDAIRQHGGTILVESQQTAGTCFKIYLPAVLTENSKSAEQE